MMTMLFYLLSIIYSAHVDLYYHIPSGSNYFENLENQLLTRFSLIFNLGDEIVYTRERFHFDNLFIFYKLSGGVFSCRSQYEIITHNTSITSTQWELPNVEYNCLKTRIILNTTNSLNEPTTNEKTGIFEKEFIVPFLDAYFFNYKLLKNTNHFYQSESICSLSIFDPVDIDQKTVSCEIGNYSDEGLLNLQNFSKNSLWRRLPFSYLHSRHWVDISSRCSSIDSSDCGKTYHNVAPPPRLLGSVVKYTTWNYKLDVVLHPSLCRLPNGDSAEKIDNNHCWINIDDNCLTNFNCFTADEDFYYNSNIWPIFSSSDFIKNVEKPQFSTFDPNCPNFCCGLHRNCYRSRNVLGERVEFDHTILLNFGGRSYQHFEFIYQDHSYNLLHNCELYFSTIETGATPTSSTTSSLRACLEVNLGDLWRFDVNTSYWHWVKPIDSSGKLPAGRHGHSGVYYEVETSVLSSSSFIRRKKFMLIFGGLSIDCINGICMDLWKYEIPFASSAYYDIPSVQTTISEAINIDWKTGQGNVWTPLADCPFGGRTRFTSWVIGNENFYVFGGQSYGKLLDELLLYRISLNIWEKIEPSGHRNFYTSNSINYFNELNFENDSPQYNWKGEYDFSKHILKTPVTLDESVASGVSPPHLPIGVIDVASSLISNINGPDFPKIVYFSGGYSTLSPYYIDDVWELTISSANTMEWKDKRYRRSPTRSTISTSKSFRGNLSTYAHPSPRRGSTMTYIEKYGLSIVHGGLNQDEVFSDVYIFHMEHGFYTLNKFDHSAPKLAYHSSISIGHDSADVYFFGGISYESTNLQLSDVERDLDRRCLKQSRDLITKFTNNGGLSRAISSIQNDCDVGTQVFCCLSDFTLIETLDELSLACKFFCQSIQFTSLYTPLYNGDIYILSLDDKACDNCHHGDCHIGGFCLCHDGWYGADCNDQLCPGSICVSVSEDYNWLSSEPQCSHCSGHGNCLKNSTMCECFEGFSGPDCSAVNCDGACSIDNGVCIGDYPLFNCVCLKSKTGFNCDMNSCPNACSFHGECLSTKCACESGYAGEDCSIYLFEFESYTTYSVYLGILLWVLLMM